MSESARETERDGASARRWLLPYALATVAWGPLLVLSYNLYRREVQRLGDLPLEAARKAAIKGAIPWSVVLFCAVTVALGVALRRPHQLLGVRRRWWGLFALQAVVQHGACVLYGGVDRQWVLAIAFTALAAVGGGVELSQLAVEFLRGVVRGRTRSGETELRVLRLAVAHLALAAGVALLASQLVAQLSNTLEANGRWHSAKLDLERGVVGAASYMATRVGLSRSRLDLGVWHGYQYIWTELDAPAQAVEFSTRMGPRAWVCVTASPAPESAVPEADRARPRHGSHPTELTEGVRPRTASARGGELRPAADGSRGSAAAAVAPAVAPAPSPFTWGLRMGRHPDYPCAEIGFEEGGRFTRRRTLDAPELDGGWHRVRCDFRTGRVSWDGEPWTVVDTSSLRPLRIGFRGGLASAYVDDVVVELEGGEVFSEDFGHRGGRGMTILIVWLVVGGVGFALAALARRRRSARRVPALFPALLLDLTLLGSLALGVPADHYLISSSHSRHVDLSHYRTTIETSDEAIERLAREFDEVEADAGARVALFLGSSQTWGAGARHAQETWVARVGSALDGRPAERPDPTGVEHWRVLDAGVSGANSTQLLGWWRAHWRRPVELLVIDLSHNDTVAPVLGENVRALADEARALGTRVVLVLEPNTIERSSQRLAANHAALREVAAERDLPLVDMPTLLADVQDTGFLWWDAVHLTSYGQELFARRLVETLESRGLLR